MEGYKTISFDGVEYYLVPKFPQGQPKKETSDIISDYQPVEKEDGDFAEDTSIAIEEIDFDVEEAMPSESEHRKRFKERRLEAEDLAKGRGIPLDKIREFHDINEVEQTVFRGEKLFFGDGLQRG